MSVEKNKKNSVRIRDAEIKLGQALKLSGLLSSGSDAKRSVQGGEVIVNGEVELRRGRKLCPGDEVSYKGESFVIEGCPLA